MATIMPDTKLSANDARILNALFDPETLPSWKQSQEIRHLSTRPYHRIQQYPLHSCLS